MIMLLIAVILLLLLYAFPPVEIVGDSMLPSLKNGEWYLGFRFFRFKNCKVNDIFIYNPPDSEDNDYLVIKRATLIKDKCFWFIGDNTNHSHDSRHYGWVSDSRIRAKLLFKIKRR